MIWIMKINGMQEALPRQYLSRVHTLMREAGSGTGGIAPRYYDDLEGTLILTSDDWTLAEAEEFTRMWDGRLTTLDLPEEEHNAFVTRLNSNVESAPPS